MGVVVMGVVVMGVVVDGDGGAYKTETVILPALSPDARSMRDAFRVR